MGDFFTRRGAEGDAEKAKQYADFATTRGDAIHKVMWNDEQAMWTDYDLKTKAPRTGFYLSDMVPIFAKCSGSLVDITETSFLKRVLDNAKFKEITSFAGGFPQSLVKNGHEQWDFPNAWSPNQLMVIEGFAANPDTRAIAKTWAQKWVNAVYTGYKKNATFYEKYDAVQVGSIGGGGEYAAVEGFGWTNGGILRLLEMFPTDLVSVGANNSGVSSLAGFSHLLFASTVLVATFLSRAF
jgi:alpha,alpha-trehalase